MAERLDKCHEADFTISFQVEGQEVMHKEAAVCLGVTEESQFPKLRVHTTLARDCVCTR